MKDILLFDIDGVLVEPRGYRAAVRAAAGYFLDCEAGRAFPLPDDDDYAWLEAHRITSEWDMVPLLLAAALEHLLAQGVLPQAPPDLEALAAQSLPCPTTPPDHPVLIAPLLPFLKPGEYPSETALRLLQAHGALTGTDSESLQNQGPLFPHLAGTPLAQALFSDTRTVRRSPTTRIFQNYCLGSEAFHQAYGLEPSLETPSLLRSEDRSLLSTAHRDILLQRWAAREIGLAAYTLRPSLPPPEAPEPPLNYSPEAEQALELAGLAGIPAIGYGRILYLAQKHSMQAETLVKPSPVQALAAIFAALERRELPALELALRLFQGDERATAQQGAGWPGSAVIHIFEDSAGGIEAVLRAGQALAGMGLQVRIQPWGIAEHPEKVKALRSIGVPIFPTLDSALSQVL